MFSTLDLDCLIIQPALVVARHQYRGLQGRSGDTRPAGFTIIELMIVVAVIGVLSIMAIPAFMNARIASQNASFLNTLRLLGQNMDLYSLEAGRGDYPPDAPISTSPPGFEDRNPRGFSWAETTPIGGKWDWDRALNRNEKVYDCYAGISVVSPSRTSAQMGAIDAKIDDADLNTGNFRRHATGYIYVIEE